MINSTFRRNDFLKNNIVISPFNKLSDTSLTNLLNKDPLNVLFAKPCTIIAEDCTPTFPAIAAISSVKRINFRVVA
jgi:hypothetical protein